MSSQMENGLSEGHRQFTDSIHTMFGTSMHEVIQTFLTQCTMILQN